MLRRIKDIIRDYFGFTKKETNGFLVIIIIMNLFLFLPLIYKNYFLVTKEYQSGEKDQKILDSLVSQLKDYKSSAGSTKVIAVPHKPKLFPFNPNKASLQELEALGISPDIAGRIINYRNKGGRFFTKNDLLKIYDFPKGKFFQLSPYITLPSKLDKRKEPARLNPQRTSNVPEEKESAPFDINLADTIQLQQIYGIGPVLSSRIVKYREILGGFVSMEQLLEVYGLDSVVVHKLHEKSEISDDFTPLKINLNTADLNTLKSHPYISYNLARMIIAFREQHGPFNRLEDLKEIHPISEDVYNKIHLYLKI